jgi:hypothetical protein
MKPINTNKIQGSHTGSLHANSGSREETKLLPETDGPCSEIGALINEMSQAHDWLLNDLRELRESLGLILAPPAPEAKVCERDVVASPLGSWIQAQIGLANEARQIVIEIKARSRL